MFPDEDPLHLVETHLVIPPIIQRRRPRRLMGRHLLRELAPATIPKILGVFKDSCKLVRFNVNNFPNAIRIQELVRPRKRRFLGSIIVFRRALAVSPDISFYRYRVSFELLKS
jgi:hypothetical protein